MDDWHKESYRYVVGFPDEIMEKGHGCIKNMFLCFVLLRETWDN